MAIESGEDLKRLLEELGDSFEEGVDASEQLSRTLKRYNKDLRDSQSTSKLFMDALKGNAAQVKDLTKVSKAYDAAINDAVESMDALTEANLEQEKAETLKRMSVVNAKIAAQNFAIGMGGAAKSILSGAADFVKGLQGTAEGTELTGQAALRGVETIEKTTLAFSGLSQVLGQMLMLFGPGKLVKFLGGSLFGLGEAVDTVTPMISETFKQGITILNTEVEKTKKSFRDVSGAGAVLGGGMTELRKISADAGLDVGQMATIVKSNTAYLSSMGVGMGDATIRLGKISKELRNSELGQQLRKLGLSVEEQGEMAAFTASMLNSSGKLRNMTDKEVAATTIQYTKDLKVLQGLTGQDAKKKLEDARVKSLEADVYAQAMIEGGQEAVLKLQQQLSIMPDVLKKGYLEFVSTGGAAVVDAATNVAIVQNPKIIEQYQQQFNTLRDINKNATMAFDESARLSARTAQAATESAKEFLPIGQAGRLVGDSLAQGATDITNGLILLNTNFTEGAVTATKNAVEAAAKNQAALDVQIAGIDETVQRMKSAFGEEMTGMITAYTATTGYATTAVEEFTTSLGKATDALANTQSAPGETTKTFMDALMHVGATTATWAAGGAAVGGIPSLGLGAAPGAVMGGAAGLTQGLLDLYRGEYATGGIVRDPGFAMVAESKQAEAIVPLPDNRSIPVTLNGSALDTTEITTAIDRQAKVLNQILTAMEKNNQLTSGILQSSY